MLHHRRRASVTNRLLFFILLFLVILTRSFLANRDLNTLRSKTLAERCALNYARESLGRVDMENIGEAGREDRGRGLVGGQGRWATRIGRGTRNADIDE